MPSESAAPFPAYRPVRLREAIKSDLLVYHALCAPNITTMRKAGLFIRAYLDRDFRIVFWTRVAARLVRGPSKCIGLLLYFRLKSRYGVDISPWAQIGLGLRLMHAFDIVIGPEVKVGNYCCMFNGVTLGNSRPDLDGQRMPTIGDFCVLGTGCKILGSVHIPAKTLVGANLVVTRSRTGGSEGQLDPLYVRHVADSYIRRMGQTPD